MKKILNFYPERKALDEEVYSEQGLDDIFADKDEYEEILEELCPVLEQIKLLALDVDGVLTDGTLYMGSDGEMLKGFNAKDGMGISYAIRSGLKVCLITGRKSKIVRRRAAELGITYILDDVTDKAEALRMLAAAEHVKLAEIAYVGDDLNDLAPMAICGLSCAPADAAEVVLEHCDLELLHDGGKGAVREVIDLLLSAQDKLDTIIGSYLHFGQGDKQ